jgi:hypothetical protein
MAILDRSLYGSSKHAKRDRKREARPKPPRVRRYDGKGRLNPEIASRAPQISDQHYRFLTDGREREPIAAAKRVMERTIEEATAVFRAQHLANKLALDAHLPVDEEFEDD